MIVACAHTTDRADPDHCQGQAQFSKNRPDIGWSDPRVLEVEQRTGTLVYRMEKHVTPATTSAGITLAHTWCYLDRDGHVLDLDEHISD